MTVIDFLERLTGGVVSCRVSDERELLGKAAVFPKAKEALE